MHTQHKVVLPKNRLLESLGAAPAVWNDPPACSTPRRSPLLSLLSLFCLLLPALLMGGARHPNSWAWLPARRLQGTKEGAVDSFSLIHSFGFQLCQRGWALPALPGSWAGEGWHIQAALRHWGLLAATGLH